MKIMVCLKQVPHQDARLDVRADGTWIQVDNIKFEINSYDTYGLEEALRRFAGPVFGTCAGMILLDRNHLDLVDVEVDRNAYGRQVASFEADLELEGETEPLRGVFIRAPRVRGVGPGVEVLAQLDGEPVLLREGRFLVASFHPELTDDTRVHEQFLALVREEANVGA